MNLTLYSVKSNDLQLMTKVPLWILDGALCVRESRGEMTISSLGPGIVGCGEKEIKREVPFGK